MALALIILVTLRVLVYRNRLPGHQMYPEHGVSIGWIEDVGPRRFTYEELKEVTKDFKDEIGNGAFGTVYKGTLLNRRKAAAIKRLENISSDGNIEFRTEVKIIGRSHHRNLFCLLGYCEDGYNRLLVYEYMTNGSLADLLFTPERQLHWEEKMGIARYIAGGLLYLHKECETQIIHCNIKLHNILLDENGRVKISDFGLSKMLKPYQTKTMTGMRVTRGYIALEWHKKLQLTVKADIYSFRIVLLEIICNWRSLDWHRSEDEAILEEWVYGCF
ncbi:G-type lectin S-receptor-like serine/threonine-protein kinase RLK1 [Syzygium oleosum]|uniref:G-type lectin S-receptor-like serine/threonine-protein kinase RLK1 n=1 Tax=Syzygium oleosum TaxID=219896 RepID=UPI0024BB49D9|nr:G-type lectin S-receptor-like serine/threonine-protein kinase RLK1 [Syzygium oleosum]